MESENLKWEFDIKHQVRSGDGKRSGKEVECGSEIRSENHEMKVGSKRGK